MEKLLSSVGAFVPLVLTIAASAVVLVAADRILIKRAKLTSRNRPPHQLVMIVLSLLALVAVILAIPVASDVRRELLGLLGIVLTGIIAFSSTTFVANMMAGLMLRSVKSFIPGDFIQAGEHFGKVTERGLFHTEIQSEDRDLITLPNLYLTANPVKVVRSSGTALSCRVSLGYDVPHDKVFELLSAAAERAGLKDPFVQIETLGDFSVTYKAAGFYETVENLLSTRSALKAAVLDCLHQAGVEIVSPSFMNQRLLEKEKRFVPQPREDGDASAVATIFPETLLFDKANKAKRLEMLEARRQNLIEQLKTAKKSDDATDETRAQIERLESQINISEILIKREQEKEST